MKSSYWIASILASIAISAATGFVIGQQTTNKSYNISELTLPPLKNEPSLAESVALSDKDNTLTELESDSNLHIGASGFPSETDDIHSKIKALLFQIDKNPNKRSLSVKLHAIIEALSVEQLLSLSALLEDQNNPHRLELSIIIVRQLVEKAPEKAFAFAQQYNSMPDPSPYLTNVQASVAEKLPKLGFEYLKQLLEINAEDIKLSDHSLLIDALGKADIKQLVDVLAEMKNRGVNIENSFFGIAYDLTTSEEHLSLFNELRRLNDMSVLSSVISTWLELSPDDVFGRINEIEDPAERESLKDTAFHYWVMKEPTIAANYGLANASNKLETLKGILRFWPNKKPSEALRWISAQSDIDNNRYKIQYLDSLSYSNPKFVEAHINEVELDDDEKIDFYKNIYEGYQRTSSADAEQFLSKLPFRNQIVSDTTEDPRPKNDYIAKIDKAYRRYFDFKYEKAFAVSIDNNGAYTYSFVVNKASQHEANELAIRRCDHNRHKYNVDARCQIYAEGDIKLFEISP